jgi:hypothetical protein
VKTWLRFIDCEWSSLDVVYWSIEQLLAASTEKNTFLERRLLKMNARRFSSTTHRTKYSDLFFSSF